MNDGWWSTPEHSTSYMYLCVPSSLASFRQQVGDTLPLFSIPFHSGDNLMLEELEESSEGKTRPLSTTVAKSRKKLGKWRSSSLGILFRNRGPCLANQPVLFFF